MDPSVFEEAFPPLTRPLLPSTAAGNKSSRSWDRILSGPTSNACEFLISPLPTEEEIINFPTEDIAEAINEWDQALVGYSLGKRPYYEALLNSVKKLWNLKGSLKLISLSDGFFLFKFSNAKDFDLVWSRGAWFILEKPFIFQKWNSHFSPTREELLSVSIWFKIHDLPLCCWTPVGISKIATKVGHPLAVDALTASKSRLTFARVCVQVDDKATFPETIHICVEGKLFNLKIQYKWRPTFCEFFGSLNHSSSKCSANPNPEINHIPNPPRGRSTSRRPIPQSLNSKGILPIPNSTTINSDIVGDSAKNLKDIPVNTDHDLIPTSAYALTKATNQNTLPISSAMHTNVVDIPTKEGAVLNSEITKINKNVEQCPLTDNTIPINIIAGASSNIPNLNSPTSLTSSTSASMFHSDGQKEYRVTSANKFSVVQDDNEDDSSSSLHNEGMEDSKGILSSNLLDPWFCSTHKIFENELSFDNFDLATPARIWIKWNSDKVSFNPISSSPHMISGHLMVGSQIIMLISAVYASNSFEERNKLWVELREVNPHGALPWAVIGDFNTCRLQTEKKGGNIITMDRLYPFNSFIFDNNLIDLPSTGNFHTWFNQRQDNPIHLKLDRVLVNETWINQFPNSHYNVLSSLVSDHTPLILIDVPTKKTPKRFMYKNYWSHIPDFWSIL
ncbi:uncharacterized protein LOC114579597 [Dendrobium catenatum]|uniref:uncharacterized protein LOC114579597 n=1 Tax=Dendrobium catenatum TaxID=906689 RepID=UPI00109F13D4|nr:uncharacterized protein LOC114579597 [Dendrobium catenatum]